MTRQGYAGTMDDRRDHPSAEARPNWVVIAVASLLTVLIRLRAFWTPITSDEGGFIAIARAWGNGGTLYRDVWVDRPQGLLALFRFWDWVSGGSTASVRIMAMLFGVGLVIAVGVAATALAGRTAGGLAAVLVGITAASPAIEGHLANGELLSGAVAAAGFACACVAVRRPERQWLFVLSGVLGGGALSIKQSGYEGLLAIGLWLVVAVVMHWRTPRDAAGALLRVIVGVGAVIGLLALHGAITGYSRWWFAFAGYRLGQRSAIEGADWDRFFTTARIARPTIWPLLALIALGAMVVAMTHDRRREVCDRDPAEDRTTIGAACLLWLWPVAGAIAFATGGQFHRHYWITLCPGLSALAAGLLARRFRPSLAFGVALVALVPTYVNTFKILHTTDREFPVAASGDNRPNTDERIAAWFRANSRPGDQIYVMCASAGFYADAHEDPVFAYLWQDNVGKVPGALDKLRALLGSQTAAPRFIASYQTSDTCDPSGALGAVVTANYREFTVTDGVAILERISRT